MNSGTSSHQLYVLYHANCLDGTGAKYAAWKKFGKDAVYIPVQYGKPFPELVPLTEDSEVYILDFSYSKEVLIDVHSKVGSLVVLDHHKTAQAELSGLLFAVFDMEKSGAVMAWEFFNAGTPVPQLLLNIEDGDLWKFTLPFTKEVRAGLPLLGGKMEAWDMVCLHGNHFADLVTKGAAIMEHNKMKVGSVVKGGIAVLPYKGYKAGVYNTTVLVSEMGEAVYNSEKLGVDFSMSFFVTETGEVVISFRSRGNMDVSVLAKELGGGGHKNAAGAGQVTLGFIQDLFDGKL